MKRLLALVTLFLCFGLHFSQKEMTAVSPTTAKDIFIGWVDISLDDWATLGYESRQEWSDVIDSNNQAFQQLCRSKLVSLQMQVTGAKNRSDEHASALDLHVKFSDVAFDVESYGLYAAVHFIDPKSGKELASVPRQAYRGGHFSVSNCLRGALEKMAEKIRVQLVGRRFWQDPSQ